MKQIFTFLLLKNLRFLTTICFLFGSHSTFAQTAATEDFECEGPTGSGTATAFSAGFIIFSLTLKATLPCPPFFLYHRTIRFIGQNLKSPLRLYTHFSICCQSCTFYSSYVFFCCICFVSLHRLLTHFTFASNLPSR